MKQPPDLSAALNVLIIRADHLGDLLLSTPLIRTMRAALPGRRFTLIASPANAGALAGWDALDEIRVYDPSWSFLRKWRFVSQLRRTRWDLCLTLSPRTPSYVLGALSGAPVRAGIIYSRRVAARMLSPLWLTHPVVLSVDECLAAGEPVPHEVEQLSEVVAVLGINAAPGPLEMPLQEDETAWARHWLSISAEEGSRLIAIHGAGKWLSKGWTPGNFIALVRSLPLKSPGTKIVLTFGPGDTVLEEAAEELLTDHPDPAVLLPGPLSVPRWAALLSLCDAVVTPDTGSLHLAVAVGRPVVAMYEDASYLHCAAQWAPWKVPHVLVRRQSLRETQTAILNGLATLLPHSGKQT